MHPALAPYVDSLVAYDSDAPDLPSVHRGLPSTSVTFVIAVGQPLDLSWESVPGSRRTLWSTVSGLHAGPALIHQDGSQHGVQLALTPAGTRALLGVPAASVAREIAELTEVVPRTSGLEFLPERLAAAPDPAARMRVVEEALLHALGKLDPATSRSQARPEVGRALAALTGTSSVAEVADEVGFSRRHLGSLVRAECGVGPKEYARIARFDRSRRELSRAARAGRVALADLATSCGYADQAHLTREWRTMAGCTPTGWLRTEFPFLQDRGDGGGAG